MAVPTLRRSLSYAGHGVVASDVEGVGDPHQPVDGNAFLIGYLDVPDRVQTELGLNALLDHLDKRGSNCLRPRPVNEANVGLG